MASNDRTKEPIKPDWDQFSGLIEQGGGGLMTTSARSIALAGPAVALAVAAPTFESPLVQVLAVACAGGIGLIQAVAELVRRTRETPHDVGTHRRR